MEWSECQQAIEDLSVSFIELDDSDVPAPGRQVEELLTDVEAQDGDIVEFIADDPPGAARA